MVEMSENRKADNISRLRVLAFLALFLVMFSFVPANAAQVAVTVETLTENGGGFLVEPTLIPLSGGNLKAAQMTLGLLSSNSLNVDYTGSPTSAYFFITAIGGFGPGTDGQGGWMVTVNDKFIKYSAGVYTLKQGDVMRWQYTKNYGLDIGTNIWDWDETSDPVPSTLINKDALIWKVAEINSAGNGSSYGSAYTSAMSVLKNRNASPGEISSALAALNNATPNDEATPDTGITPGEPDPETNTDITPADPGTTPDNPTPDSGTNTGTTPGDPGTTPDNSTPDSGTNTGTSPGDPGTTPDSESADNNTSGAGASGGGGGCNSGAAALTLAVLGFAALRRKHR